MVIVNERRVRELQKEFEEMCIDAAGKKQVCESEVRRKEKLLQVITESGIRGNQLDEYNKKLHNRKLELKGNIRVFCRVRPILQSDINVMMKKMGKDYMPTSLQSK
jgi:Microtubule binding